MNYPTLPLPMHVNLTAGLPGRAIVEYYTADQMRAYVNADRAQRKPMTDEQIEEICWTEVDQRLRSFARAIEAHHVIGVKP